MDRQPPRAISDEIDLYIRTYYSLLRASGDVRVRAFEEAHLYARSSLHLGAESPTPDVAAFAYSAARLPDCMPEVKRIVIGQNPFQFTGAGFDIRQWKTVRTRGRRRPLRWDEQGNLAAFAASASDIDDLIPIVTAYQIEWNKLHLRLAQFGRVPAADEMAAALAIQPDEVAMLRAALGARFAVLMQELLQRPCDVSVRLLDGAYREYQRSAQRWWRAIQPATGERRPVYFVSSNSHSMANLFGGYARMHQAEVEAFLNRENPEGLATHLAEAKAKGDAATETAILYYSLRAFLHDDPERILHVQQYDALGGVTTISSPGRIDVAAQVIDLSQLVPERLDPRLAMPHLERLAYSKAVVVNIDYPLGLAAYHHFSAVALGVEELRGVYIMGKAATLNGRVGDVMLSKVVHDEHSKNTYLFRNALKAGDIQPYLHHGTLLDNQKALTVRSAYLQNREYMDVFYREGYTVMEMEAGPYLSALYETVAPSRHPRDEIVSLIETGQMDIGVVHYASDTPYSRRQSLLSKSLSFFGMESTYACSIAIARRILALEIQRLAP